MHTKMPKQVTSVIGGMENALRRRDYPVLSGLLNEFEQWVLEVGDASAIESVRKLRTASDLGTEIEKTMGRGSQLDPDNAENQHWLRVGMFKHRQVPEALVRAAYAPS